VIKLVLIAVLYTVQFKTLVVHSWVWLCLYRHLNELLGSELLLCLTLTSGALPAIPVMWFSEQVVDYCGHSNLLIIAFIFYIVRYTGSFCWIFHFTLLH